ncbi:hypothetical protein KY289_008183 [Solanum tuberosum]|nr:hypothetical protein KY289_008183 [Solanum tuberosum]
MSMDTNSHVFILWEECVVSQGKDHCVVHYYLKDSSGEMILVVVGTERSARHMVFVILEDYLDAFGHTSSINSETKWRAKRDMGEQLMEETKFCCDYCFPKEASLLWVLGREQWEMVQLNLSPPNRLSTRVCSSVGGQDCGPTKK